MLYYILMTISLEKFTIDAESSADDILAVSSLLGAATGAPASGASPDRIASHLLAYDQFRGPGNRGSFEVSRDKEGVIRALAYVVRYTDSMELTALGVAERYRGQGLGRAVLEILEGRADEGGLSMWLYANRLNKRGRRFFRENGFEELPSDDFRQDDDANYVALERPPQTSCQNLKAAS